MPTSNDHVTLIPRTTFDTPALHFDLAGVRVGIAEYDEGPTGCTVFHFPDGVRTAIDERGGMIGMTQANDYCHAICLAGGSLMGLEAVSGAAASIFAQGGYVVDHQPVMNGAIIFDYYFNRSNTIYPDKALGRAALEAAKPGVFPLGARGAGRNAGVGGVLDWERKESSGQGGAYRAIGAVKVAVFTVVNAVGVIVDRSGQIVRGNLDPATGQRKDPLVELEERDMTTDPPQKNTTLTVLVVNQKLRYESLVQLGRQVHSSMARAIRPFHTQFDGDVLFTVTTDEVESDLNLPALGLFASELAWDAVLAAVR
jgi:L-aminopeptidase/D-esterase-like protein